MNKTEWRAHIRAKRVMIDAVTHRHKSQQLGEHLLKWLSERNPGFEEILGYYSVKQEPDLSSFFAETYLKSKKIFLPAIRDHVSDMDFFGWQPGEAMVANRYGIPEPLRRDRQPALRFEPAKILALVPAMAVDSQGYRLGYGAGYYDRFLASYPEITTVGVVFSEFVVDCLPTESHDLPLAWIATEDRVFQVRP